jgi:hypothetical protein
MLMPPGAPAAAAVLPPDLLPVCALAAAPAASVELRGLLMCKLFMMVAVSSAAKGFM